MKYYRLLFKEKNLKNDSNFEESTVLVMLDDSKESINDYILREYERESKDSNAIVKIDAQEVSINEYISIYEDDFKRDIINLLRPYNENSTIKEYSEYSKNKDNYAKSLNYLDKYIRINKMLRKIFDVSKISVSDFDDYTERLTNVSGSFDFGKVAKKILLDNIEIVNKSNSFVQSILTNDF